MHHHTVAQPRLIEQSPDLLHAGVLCGLPRDHELCPAPPARSSERADEIGKALRGPDAAEEEDDGFRPEAQVTPELLRRAPRRREDGLAPMRDPRGAGCRIAEPADKVCPRGLRKKSNVIELAVDPARKGAVNGCAEWAASLALLIVELVADLSQPDVATPENPEEEGEVRE